MCLFALVIFSLFLSFKENRRKRDHYLLHFGGESTVLDNCPHFIVHTGSLEVGNNYLGEGDSRSPDPEMEGENGTGVL